MELNTNSDLFPEGTYFFRVAEVPELGETKTGHMFYKFTFVAEVDGEECAYQERFMRWLMAPLLRALRFQEKRPGIFDFEPTMALGRQIEASIRHEKLEKGPRAGDVVARMKDIKPFLEMNKTTGQTLLPKDEEIPF